MGAPIAGSGRIESSDPFAGGGGPVGLRDCPAHRRLTPETLVPFDALALGGLSQARWRLARRSRVTLRSTKSLIRVLRQLVGEQRQRDTDQQRCDHRGDHRAPEVGPSFTVDLLPRDLGGNLGRSRNGIPQLVQALVELIHGGHGHPSSASPRAARCGPAGQQSRTGINVTASLTRCAIAEESHYPENVGTLPFFTAWWFASQALSTVSGNRPRSLTLWPFCLAHSRMALSVSRL